MRLLVAATGGHLTELTMLAERLRPVDEDVVWVTSASSQSHSLLAGERAHYVSEVAPRDWRAVVRNTITAGRLLSREVTSVVSTGSGIALAYLPLARARGIPAHYIECSARVDGYSLTGRLLGHVQGIRRYTQYSHLAVGGWSFGGSVFDGFAPRPVLPRPALSTVLVTVGTVGFPFMRLFERLRRILPREIELTIQAGPDSSRVRWPKADVWDTLPADELERKMREFDLVIAHAGVGSALSALRAGKVPILVPRRAEHGEHIDDHQMEIARYLGARGLAISADADRLGPTDIEQALRRGAVKSSSDRAFVLD